MASKLTIAVVEDHHVLRDAMVSALETAGFNAYGAMSAEELDTLLLDTPPDIYILDLNLPGEDGLSLAGRLRGCQPGCGIIMLTARNLKQDRIQGYKSGADVYLMKPTDLDELLAAVESLAERLDRGAIDLSWGNGEVALTLFTERREIAGPGGREAISQREVLMLSALARSRFKQLESWELMELLGGDREAYQKSSLEVAIARLRRKLDRVIGAEGSIAAVRGRGYALKREVQIL
jgi:DNA-binding response OmpR family regulator